MLDHARGLGTASRGEARVRPEDAIAPARSNWDLFELDVAASHRAGLAGRLVTTTKRVLLQALGPVHRELLGPQRAFNRRLLEQVTRLIEQRPADPEVTRSVEQAYRATEQG